MAPANPYPRDLAIRVLTRVLSDHATLDEALASLTGEVPASSQAWLQEVCAGTLRWMGRLDQAVDSTALKKKPTGWLRKALLLAAYQLIGQDRTNPGAVVSETVDLVRKKEGEAPAKFANAALRKISEHSARWKDLPLPKGKENEAAWASLPPWFWGRLVKDHGREWATQFARACLERPVTWIRAKDSQWKPQWAEEGPIAGAFRASEGGLITAKEGFPEGKFVVQDISSQTLIREIGSTVREQLGGKIRALDLCAAPGGKSVGLAWEGFDVSATDRDEARFALLRQTVSRAAPEVKITPRDKIAGLTNVDFAWVDAPCTGTGIIRRHPDVRWLRREKELDSLTRLQGELLKEAWEKVRPGGFLAYSVCSVFSDEGPGLVKKSGLGQYQVREWLLAPQTAPFGDGFWAGLLRKPT
ncbi:MAG: RsmB/NOP family class I SAM-dependent RNA methyltransferase [Bdellovibrionota bacterium]